MIISFLVNVVFTLYLYVSVEAKVTSISIKNCTCGLKYPVQSRIFEGKKEKKEEFPWQVGFIYEKKIFCGGSIINEKYVLTAARCFKTYNYDGRYFLKRPPSKVRIIFGSSKIDFSLLSKGKRIFSTIRIPMFVIIHPHYNAIKGSSDICLVKIHNPFKEYTPKLHPICLPVHGFSYINSVSIVTGWGMLYEKEFLVENELRKAETSVLYPLICELKYPRYFLKKTMICASNPEGDTCAGDLGGPLITRLNKNQYVQIGITTFGYRCGNPSMPGIYTKVDEFVPWIMKRTKDATSCKI